MKRALALAIMALLAVSLIAPAASADSHEEMFDLTVMHRINGEPLGLDRDLPVDVYVNGGKAFTFELSDTVRTSLPAGEYDIEVKLAGTDVVVLSLYDAEIPAGADVKIMAKRTGLGIGLKVQVK